MIYPIHLLYDMTQCTYCMVWPNTPAVWSMHVLYDMIQYTCCMIWPNALTAWYDPIHLLYDQCTCCMIWLSTPTAWYDPIYLVYHQYTYYMLWPNTPTAWYVLIPPSRGLVCPSSVSNLMFYANFMTWPKYQNDTYCRPNTCRFLVRVIPTLLHDMTKSTYCMIWNPQTAWYNPIHWNAQTAWYDPVSYTHLTLPTSIVV